MKVLTLNLVVAEKLPVRESLQKLGIPRNDDDIFRAHPGFRARVFEGLAGGLHADDSHAEALLNLGFGDREALNIARWVHLDNGEAVLHFDVIEHLAGHHVCHARSRIELRVHHVVGANPAQDPAV